MKSKGKVLAKGETTGHAHKLQHTEIFEEDTNYLTFEVVRDDEFVSHEEHRSIPIARGKRAAGQVQEYDHFEEESKVVTD